MRGETNIETAAKLADCFPFATVEFSPDNSQWLAGIEEEVMVSSAAQAPYTAHPHVWGKARTADWEP